MQPEFNGSEYSSVHDKQRLGRQLDRVRSCMRDGQWRTLAEIESCTGDPAASISAQLRHLRKSRFGGHKVNKRSRGLRDRGLFEYQLVLNND